MATEIEIGDVIEPEVGDVVPAAAGPAPAAAPGATPLPVPAPRKAMPPGAKPPKVGAWWEPSEAEGRAAAAVKGVTDPMFGAAQLVARAGKAGWGMLPDNPMARGWGQVGDMLEAGHKRVGEAASAFDAEEHPWMQLTGSMISPPNVIGGKFAPGKSLMAKGATSGMLAGAVNPVDDVKNYWEHKLTDIVGGGGVGAVLGKTGQVVGSAISPVVQKAVSVLKDYGVDPSKLTLGQLLGGGARRFEDWMRDVVPMNNIGTAQERGAKEFMVAPVKTAMENIGAKVDASKAMPEVFDEAQKAVGAAYREAEAKMPLINMPVKQTASGGIAKNYGSPAFFNNVRKEAESWRRSANSVTTSQEGDRAYGELMKRIEESAKPFENQTGNMRFADPEKVTETIRTLNSELKDQYKKLNMGTGDSYTRKYIEQVEKLRDHMRSLIKNTDAASYARLRSADAAHAGIQTVQDASRLASKAKGEFTPEQLIAAANKGASTRDVAAARTRMQPYALAAQDVIGSTPPKPPSGLEAIIEKALTLPASAAINPLYSKPVQGALARYATEQSPLRRATGEMVRTMTPYANTLAGQIAGSRAAHKTLVGEEE